MPKLPGINHLDAVRALEVVLALLAGPPIAAAAILSVVRVWRPSKSRLSRKTPGPGVANGRDAA